MAKKIVAAIIAAAMLLATVGCGQQQAYETRIGQSLCHLAGKC